MNFRTVGQMSACIARNLDRLPRDVDVIVGVPRSGSLAANLLALHMNLPLTDVQGLLEGKLMDGGKRLRGSIPDDPRLCKKVLVLDDSILSGKSMAKVRRQFEDAAIQAEVVYATVYGTSRSEDLVDVCFEICEWPRMFEWNYMHHPFLAEACVDIDGVLCVDPSKHQNDDGPRYREFVLTAPPLYIPSRKVFALVTSRLEKYRAETEEWLTRNGIEFDHLFMLDLPDGETRRRLNCHAQFKADIYSKLKTRIFIESNPRQAAEIARLAKRPVICVETCELVDSSIRSRSRRKAGSLLRKLRYGVPRRLKRFGEWLAPT